LRLERKILLKEIKKTRKETFRKGDDENGFRCLQCVKEKKGRESSDWDILFEDRQEVRKHFRKHYDEVEAKLKELEKKYIEKDRREAEQKKVKRESVKKEDTGGVDKKKNKKRKRNKKEPIFGEPEKKR
jgi:hypothetical protein